MRFIATKTNAPNPASIRIILPVALGKKPIHFVHPIFAAKNYCRLVEQTNRAETEPRFSNSSTGSLTVPYIHLSYFESILLPLFLRPRYDSQKNAPTTIHFARHLSIRSQHTERAFVVISFSVLWIERSLCVIYFELTTPTLPTANTFTSRWKWERRYDVPKTTLWSKNFKFVRYTAKTKGKMNDIWMQCTHTHTHRIET